MAADPFPVPDVVNREGYCDGFLDVDGETIPNHIGYWLTGYTDYRTTTRIAAEQGVSSGRVFDFGGGTGRVFRHFAAQNEGWETWTSDFRLSSVALEPPPLHAAGEGVVQHLHTRPCRCRTGYFDLVTALFRVHPYRRAGNDSGWLNCAAYCGSAGLAFLTVHDRNTWRAVPAWRDRLRAENGPGSRGGAAGVEDRQHLARGRSVQLQRLSRRRVPAARVGQLL
jgi:hypothetical protein